MTSREVSELRVREICVNNLMSFVRTRVFVNCQLSTVGLISSVEIGLIITQLHPDIPTMPSIESGLSISEMEESESL